MLGLEQLDETREGPRYDVVDVHPRTTQRGDLVVDRRSGSLEYKVPAAGKYTVKVHDLTYHGGAAHFYRLAIREAREDSTVKAISFEPSRAACMRSGDTSG